MKWTDLAGDRYCIKLGADADPMPLIFTGEHLGTPWAWTGDFEHLLRFQSCTFEDTGSGQGKIMRGDETVAYVAPIDNTPEIADVGAFHLEIADIQSKADTDDFREWLREEIEIT